MIGGINDIATETRICESYNPVTHEWLSLTPMPTARACLGVAAMDGYVYAVGGSSADRAALDCVERYSIEEVS